jgi:hypothetical protein
MTRACFACLMAAALCAAASAVTPAQWNHASEADFAKGRTDGTLVSSAGEVQLGPAVETLWPSDEAPAAVTAVAFHDGAVYAGAADGTLSRLADGKVAPVARLEKQIVTSLASDPRGLLVSAGGASAGVYRLEGEKLNQLWSDDEAKYVWAIAPAADGTIYAATGPQGKVLAIDADGNAAVVFETGELAKNVLALALDAVNNKLFAGTDTEGLVFEIDLTTRKARVVLDAQEKEIAALVPDGRGGVFAATADVSRVASEPAAPAEAPTGKPAPADAEDGADDQPPADDDAGDAEPAAAVNDAVDEDAASEDAAGEDAEPGEPASDAAAEADGAEVANPQPAEADEPAAAAAAPTPTTAPAVDKQDAPEAPDAPQPKAAPKRPTPAKGGSSGSAVTLKGPGNAVYHVKADGLVSVVFRQKVAVLAMLKVDGRLVLGTGDDGQIFSVPFGGEPLLRVADTDAKQVTALAAGADGAVYFATANKGSVGLLGSGLADSGTFTSDVLDAEQVARWGSLQVWARRPADTAVTIQTRSGNLAEPDEKTWSDWSAPAVVTGDFLDAASPAARFLQYRLTLAGRDGSTPVVRQVRAVYQVGNLAPEIKAVVVEAAAPGRQPKQEAGPLFARMIKIQAADPNKDQLELSIYFRRDDGPWIRIVDELGEPQYAWDTRSVSDGTYELKVVASDSPANPPALALEAARISDPVTVDNTAPTIDRVKLAWADGKLTVSGRASDNSRIATIAWLLDSDEKWTPVLPDDGIADRSTESFTFSPGELSRDAHRVAIKVTDAFGNTAYHSITIPAVNGAGGQRR